MSAGADAPRSGSSGRPDAESGQIMLLTIAYALLALALVLVLASASAVHIERKQLLALADAAALDAADAVAAERFYLGDLSGVATEVEAAQRGAVGGGAVVPLTVATVRAAVVDHLEAAPAARGITGLRIGEPTGTPDGVTAEITLIAVARPPFVPWALVGWSEGIALRVSSSARAG